MNQIIYFKGINDNKIMRYKYVIFANMIIALLILLWSFSGSWVFGQTVMYVEKRTDDETEFFAQTNQDAQNPEVSSVTATYKGSEIIGYIEIKSLKINYPIFSSYNDELLKTAICKFLGPNINEVGNLCILGHNYYNNKFFSKLYELNIGDEIILYDLDKNAFPYKVFDKNIVNENDLNCLSQSSGGMKIITLITCANNSHNRTIVKAISQT